MGFFASPNAFQLYPEYWTDPKLLVCPSDSLVSRGQHTSDPMKDVEEVIRYCPPGPAVQSILSIPVSYWYTGHAITNVWDFLGYGLIVDAFFGKMGPELMLTPSRTLEIITCDPALNGPWGNLQGWAPMNLDWDISQSSVQSYGGDAYAIDWTGIDWWLSNDGRSIDSWTLYRLREGIERFFITDINNPAGSALAQSDVPVMWDLWGDPGGYSSIGITENLGGIFNHVPGGSNVLYMDGHTEFMRFKTGFPVCEGDMDLNSSDMVEVANFFMGLLVAASGAW
jgi:prepilin-type processing-associated H-X9-DG protein